MKNGNQLTFLFVNLVNPMRDSESSYPPLGPAYLAAYVHKYIGKEKVKFHLVSADFEKKIAELKPDIVGITCVSQNYGLAKCIAKFSKNEGVPYVLIGGSHISLCPESLDVNMDLGVLGEGEVTFLELINSLIEKGGLEDARLEQIDGIIYWDRGKLQTTRKRVLIRVLDDIPMPDRSLFKVDVNKAYVFSSRGCPYKCVFCASTRLWEKARFYSAEYVFKEIKELVYKYGVKKIDFADDLFIADRKRIEALRTLLEQEGLIKKMKFHVSARANLITDDLCKTLKRMNVKSVSLGLESASAEVLKYLKSGSVTVDDNSNAVETVKRHGLHCFCSFIIGAPIDTRETILETLNFIKKSKIDKFVVNVLTPFPGTPIWKYAVDKKLITIDSAKFDWHKIDILYLHSHDYNIHFAEKLSRKELYEMYLLFETERIKIEIRRILNLMFTKPVSFLNHLLRKAQSVFIRGSI